MFKLPLLTCLLSMLLATNANAQDTVKASKGDSIKIEIVCDECTPDLVAGRWDHDEFIKEMAWRLDEIKLRTKEMEFFLDPKIPSTKPAIPPKPLDTAQLPQKVLTSASVLPVQEEQPQAKSSNDRVMRIAKRVAKSILKAKLAKEKRRFGRRRDEELIKKLEFAVEADDLIELELQSTVEEYSSSRANASELGDGQLFRDFLDFIGDSEKFGDFIDNIIKLIDKIFELIGGFVYQQNPDLFEQLIVLKKTLHSMRAFV